MEKKNVPEVRFKGFSGEWEEKKLGEVVDYVKGYAFRSTDYTKDGVRIVRVSDLINNRVSEEADKIFLDINKAKSYRNYHINYEDIIITTVGSKAELKDSAVGRAIIINDNNQYLLNQNLVKIFPDKNYSSQFIYNQLLMERYTKHIENIQRGNANQANITIANLWDYQIHYTENKEQTRIGNFFRSLDNLITLRQQKHDKLVTVKKSLLGNMFPKEGESVPEVRFAGFSGDWERKSLGEAGKTFTGLSGKTKDDFGHGKGKYITYMNVFSNPVAKSDMTEPIEVDRKQNEVHSGDIFFTTSSETPDEVGMSSIWLENGNNIYLNSFCFGYRPAEEFDNYYLAYMLRSPTIRKKIVFLAQGISRHNISKIKMMEIEIALPSLPEQTAIGNFFKGLDNLITLQEKELGKLKNIKKSLLEKMFI